MRYEIRTKSGHFEFHEVITGSVMSGHVLETYEEYSILTFTR
jgi:hypothetical protein